MEKEIHPRVKKLIESGEDFMVVKCSEPYAKEVANLIKKEESSQGSWTPECEKWMSETISDWNK